MRTSIRLLVPAAALALAGFAPGAAHAQQRIRCESHGYDRAYCSADVRGGVQLVRQLSDASCRQGRSWGTSSQGIWVSDGCRAEFLVGSSRGGYGRGGYDGRGRGSADDGRYGSKNDRRDRDRDRGRHRRHDGDRGRQGGWDDRDGRGGDRGGWGGRDGGGHGRDGSSGGWDDRRGRSSISSSQAVRLCRDEVQRKVRGARDGRVSVSGASWDSRYDAYLVRWSARGDRGTCQVRGRDGKVSVRRGGFGLF